MDTWTLLYISYIHNLQILVATPGRLRDHIENTPGFATRMMGVKVLVLDEADHLLDMGFRKEIEKIIAAVPKQRQTLLFSATVPEEVSITIF
jgi:superfamily II DNA/RNA helicase